MSVGHHSRLTITRLAPLFVILVRTKQVKLNETLQTKKNSKLNFLLRIQHKQINKKLTIFLKKKKRKRKRRQTVNERAGKVALAVERVFGN